MSSPTAAAAAAAPPIADMVSVTSTAAAVAAVVVVADMMTDTSLHPQLTSTSNGLLQQQARPVSIGTPLTEIPLDTTFTGPALQAEAPVHASMEMILASSASDSPKLNVDTSNTSYIKTIAGEHTTSTPSSTAADGARRSHSMKSDGLSASSNASVATGAASQREGDNGSCSTIATHSSLSDGLKRAASGKSIMEEEDKITKAPAAGVSAAEATPALKRLLSIHKLAHNVPPGETQLVNPEVVHADELQAAVLVIPPTPSFSENSAQSPTGPARVPWHVSAYDSHARNASLSSVSGSHRATRQRPTLSELRTSTEDLERRNAKTLPQPGTSSPSPTSPMLPEYLLGLYSAEALAASELALGPLLRPGDVEQGQSVLPTPRSGVTSAAASRSTEALTVPARTASMSGSASSSADSVRSSSARERPSLRAALHRSSRYFLGASSKYASSNASNDAASSSQTRPMTGEVSGFIAGTGSSSRLRPPGVREASSTEAQSASFSPHSEKLAPPLRPPRSHSPFLFRRKSRNALKTTDEGEESSAAAAARTRKDSSCTAASKARVERKSNNAATPPPASHARHDLPNRFTRSRFSQRFSLNDPAWSRGSSAAAALATAAGGGKAVSPPSSIRANVGVERMDGVPVRPGLRRTRSKSVDAMRKVYLDEGAQQELGVQALEMVTADDADSMTAQASPTATHSGGSSLRLRAELAPSPLFTTPLLTPESQSPANRSVDLPAIDEPLSRPPSRWSQALSRKRASTGPVKLVARMGNSSQDKVASSSSAPKGLSKRAEGAREGTLSRLTGSVRNRTSMADTKAKGLAYKARSNATTSITSLNSPTAPSSSAYEASSSSTLHPSSDSNWPIGRRSVSNPDAAPGEAWWSSEAHVDVPRPTELGDLRAALAAAVIDDTASIEALFEDAFSTAQHSSSSTNSSPRALKIQPVQVSAAVDQTVPYRPGSSRGHTRTRSSGFTRLANALSRSRPPSPTERRANTSMGFNTPLLNTSAKARAANAAAHLEHSRNNSNVTGAGGHSRNASVAGSEMSFKTSLTHASIARSAARSESPTANHVIEGNGNSTTKSTPLKRSAVGRSTPTDPTIASAARARKPHVPASPSNSPVARRQLAHAQPPSSYRASSSPSRIATLAGAASNRSPSGTQRNPNPPSTTVTRKSAVQRARGTAATIIQRARSTSMDSTAVSDTEDDPVPPPRSSSRQALYCTEAGSSDEAVVDTLHRTTSRPPSLSIETDKRVSVASPHELPRPATSLELNTRRGANGTTPTSPTAQSTSMSRRKGSQPMTLSIADDGEFLAALEDVRAQHQARIKAREEQDRRVNRMSKLGMASGLHAVQSRKPGAEREKQRSPTRSRARSASLDMESYEAEEIRQIMRNGLGTPSGVDVPPTSPESVNTSTPLERGVGKASGRLKDGAFVNDEDWKNEVSALFVTRELVQTERSYARHLESLVQAIRRMPSSTASATHAALQRRSSSGMLLSSASPSPKSSAVPAPHLVLMKNLLPRLIELSRTLAQHIDANPTAAGVGAAFQLVAPQLESAFVNWSSVAGDVMDALRVAEGPKGKAKDKIGLVPLLPLDSDLMQATVAPNGLSVGTTPRARGNKRRSTALEALSLTRPSSPVLGAYKSSLPPLELPLLEKTSPMAIEFDDPLGSVVPLSADSGVKSSRRRNTFSSSLGPPPVAPASASADLVSHRTASSTWNFTTQRRQAARVSPLPSSPAVSSSPISAGDSGTASSLPRSIPKTKALAPADILIQPTQRIPRYLLLLRELQHSTPPQSLSYLRIQRALEMLRRVAALVNAATKSSSPATRKPGSMLASWKPMAR